jgi:hypothetical protein
VKSQRDGSNLKFQTTVAPLGLYWHWNLYQGLTPLANDCRPFGTAQTSSQRVYVPKSLRPKESTSQRVYVPKSLRPKESKIRLPYPRRLLVRLDKSPIENL